LFSQDVYVQRRFELKKVLGTGLVLLLGNNECSRNFVGNTYPFRQDSTFLYYFGLDLPNLYGVIDIDGNHEAIYSDDSEPDSHIWSGAHPTIVQLAESVGVRETRPVAALASVLEKAGSSKRIIHYLPPYRAEHALILQQILGLMRVQEVQRHVSKGLIKAVVAQRSIKTDLEIQEIEKALAVTQKMHLTAMEMVRPDVYEYEVVGAMQGTAYSQGCYAMAYAPILSVRGEIMHNPYHGNRMREGQLAINDSGAESRLYYAADITRTLPVSGSFTQAQSDIYNLVLKAQQEAIAALKPGIRFLDVHLTTALCLAQGLIDLDLMRGSTEEIVARGVHALLFPHGLGHMLGLDVHDMENLGEEYVGYSDTVQRSSQFGLAALRLARELQTGFVVTVEPGLYFNAALIDQWQAQGRFNDHINYAALERYRNFGGVRIEDTILITRDGYRVLGPNIPKTDEELSSIIIPK
jgi:Xaa-Pro aminopeptidase